MAEVRRQVWRENFQKFLLFRNISDQESRTNVNVVLDQLNAEEYKENFVDYAVCTVYLVLTFVMDFIVI